MATASHPKNPPSDMEASGIALRGCPEVLNTLQDAQKTIPSSGSEIDLGMTCTKHFFSIAYAGTAPTALVVDLNGGIVTNQLAQLQRVTFSAAELAAGFANADHIGGCRLISADTVSMTGGDASTAITVKCTSIQA